MRVVDVVDQLLDDGGSVGSLDVLGVVGDDGASRSTDDDGALLVLLGISTAGGSESDSEVSG